MTLRLEAIEITTVMSGGLRYTLRLDRPEVIDKSEEPAGQGRVLHRLAVSGIETRITPRYSGGR